MIGDVKDATHQGQLRLRLKTTQQINDVLAWCRQNELETETPRFNLRRQVTVKGSFKRLRVFARWADPFYGSVHFLEEHVRFQEAVAKEVKRMKKRGELDVMRCEVGK